MVLLIVESAVVIVGTIVGRTVDYMSNALGTEQFLVLSYEITAKIKEVVDDL